MPYIQKLSEYERIYIPTLEELICSVDNALEALCDENGLVASKVYLEDSHLYSTAIYDITVEDKGVIVKKIQVEPDEQLEGIAELPTSSQPIWSEHAEQLHSLELITLKAFGEKLKSIDASLHKKIVLVEALINLSMDDLEGDFDEEVIVRKGIAGRLLSQNELVEYYEEFGG